MLAVDTNVLVRFLTRDDPEQSPIAHRLFSALAKEGEKIFVPDTALCELVWVLRRIYHSSQTTIIAALEYLLAADEIEFTSRSSVEFSLDRYMQGKGDFADYLLLAQAQDVGCRAVATFDKALLKEEGFIEPA